MLRSTAFGANVQSGAIPVDVKDAVEMLI